MTNRISHRVPIASMIARPAPRVQRAPSLLATLGLVALAACGGRPQQPHDVTPPERLHEAPREAQHPCDDFTEVDVVTDDQPDAVVFAKTATGGHCSTPHTQRTVLGRVTKAAGCPIGALAYRAWSGGQGFRTELPAIGEPSADLRQALDELSVEGKVVAYVLGCAATTDFVIVQTAAEDVKLRFWAAGRMQPTDPRFVAP